MSDTQAVVPQENVGEIDRASYIGGSDIAAIMGLGATYNERQQTPLTVYLKKIGELESDIDDDWRDYLEFRKDMEEPIIKLLRRRFDADIVSVNHRFQDKEYPFFAAEIDFLWRDQATQLIENGEIKTVEAIAYGEHTGWGEEGTSDYPVHYCAQNMWGLGITGNRKCVLAAVVGISKAIFYHLDRNDTVINEMRQRAHYFWTENVLKQIPPKPINLNDVMGIMKGMRGRPVELDDETKEHLINIRRIRGSMKAMTEEENELKFKVGKAILEQWQADPDNPPKDNALLEIGGVQVASWNLQNTTRIDPDRLRRAHPDIAREFSNTKPSRVLRFKK